MRLICKLISGEEFEFEISKSSFVIGRSSQADIVIPHEGISRKHCLIENKSGQLYITDLESANGVFIDDKKISPNQPTPVPEYLNLSFGAVQTLLIENRDQVILTRPASVIPRKESTHSGVKVPLKKHYRSGKHDIGKKKAIPKEKSSKKQFLLLASTILILAFMGYIYYKDQNAMNAPMSHEEMYE